MGLCAGLLLVVGSGVQDPAPEVAAPDASLAAKVDAAIEDGTRWLLEHQLPGGAFGSHHSPRPVEVLASFPGSQQAFQVGTTGLVVCALLESPAGGNGKRAALERAVDYLLERHAVKRQSGLEHYNVWSFGFALQAFGELLLRSPEAARADEMRLACARLVQKLQRYQALDGGWGYLSLQGYRTYRPAATSMSFTTATILVGLERAQRAGVAIPETMVQRARRAVARCRMPDGPFSYGELWNRYPAAGINRPAGAACRTPLCQYALGLFGEEFSSSERRRALDGLLVKYARFQSLGLRRPIPHESWYQISGYFYLYGHAYAGYVLTDLPPSTRRRYAPLLARATLLCRQPDGSFWDYPLYSYHKPYGTAFALLALVRARVELPGEDDS